jgi:membrane-bound metal-dependent hydrolase YbcI (DUF457 family)
VPSPIGHALGGIAIGWGSVPRRDIAAAAILAAVSIAPDLDLLAFSHRGESHSVGAAFIAGLLAMAITRKPRWAAAVTLAWGSHILLDWLSNDTRPPIGVMALWPITRDYYKAGIEIFPPVSRRYGESRFWIHNLWAVFVELLVLLPLAALAVRAFRGRQTPT